ncbi:MAG TPA: DUF3098 domain-containing protein [Bacteroidales bacterium]|jgi:hypothetical protein|nr:DUF3098 domain-containing protein [Bacteroidales bacterium]HPS70953.1 DUF3098 domain-containing protein [Bacteroidales bacterium]
MSTPTKKAPPIFRKFNYILMIIGIVVLAIGYILLAGGGSDDPNVFNPEIFNTRRIVIAPLVMLIGLIIGIVAIMYHPKVKPTQE